MEYNNDNRTPLDRLEEGFLAELLESERNGSVRDYTMRDNVRRGADKRNNLRRDNYRAVNSEISDSISWVTNDNDQCNCDNTSVCGCGSCRDFTSPQLNGVPLAMVYSPYQEWENIYDAEVGHSRGTIFKCLDFPFMQAACDCKVRNSGNR